MPPKQHPGARDLHAQEDHHAEPAGDQPGSYEVLDVHDHVAGLPRVDCLPPINGVFTLHLAAPLSAKSEHVIERALLESGRRLRLMVAPSLPVLPVSSFRLPSVAGSEDGADGCATPETKLREVFAEPGS